MVAAVVVKATQSKLSYLQRAGYFSGAANAMDNSGLQDIFTMDVEGLARIALRITVATNALAAFAIQGLLHPDDSAYVTLKSTAGQFSSPTGILVDSSGDLTTQAVGSGWFVMDVAGLSKIKIRANSSAAGGSTMAISGSGI